MQTATGTSSSTVDHQASRPQQTVADKQRKQPPPNLTRWKATPQARRRAMRGFIRHIVRPQRERNRTESATVIRSLSGSTYQRSWKDPPRDGTRRCRWCWQPVDRRGTRWHRECLRWFGAARGLTTYPVGQTPLIPRQRCCKCSAAAYRYVERFNEWAPEPLQLDHAIGLALADELGRWWSVRARTPDNLRWLCRGCHAVKTADEARAVRACRDPHETLRRFVAYDATKQLALDL